MLMCPTFLVLNVLLLRSAEQVDDVFTVTGKAFFVLSGDYKAEWDLRDLA